MQTHDLSVNPSIGFPSPDLPVMPSHYSPIYSPNHLSSKTFENINSHVENCIDNDDSVKNSSVNGSNSIVIRRDRPSRACTQRAAARMQAAAEAEAAVAEAERKKKKAKKKARLTAKLLKEDSEEWSRDEEEDVKVEEGETEQNEEEDEAFSSTLVQCSKMVTKLVGEPEPSQLPRWGLRSMWQLASILNFLNVFRPLLNIKVEFSVEELETALITPNNTLADIHIPLLRAIPPITRMALGRGTWVTVLCRKLRDWWHWVADGDIPIVASHGTEIEFYNALDPGVRVVILKALCDIRVELDDIRNYIEDSMKRGVHLSAFRKERIGGDAHGVSFWYENDPIIGHRLYREIRKVEMRKGKGKGKNVPPIPHSSYQWETVATNLDEFQTVCEKLFTSKNRTEISVGKKLRNEMLPEIEKVHKKKEKQLKKQHRQAILLDNMVSMDGLAGGRSLRDRKHVTYTFDDYDRSIKEAIKVTKNRPPSPEPFDRRDHHVKPEGFTNGRLDSPSQCFQDASFSAPSPISPDTDEIYDEQKTETMDRGNRRRQRPQRYSMKDFVEAVSDNEMDFDSDDDVVGEVVYDEEYLKKRKRRNIVSSSSEGDEEYNWDEENHKEEEDEEEYEEEEEEDDGLSTSEESDDPRKLKALPNRTRRGTKLRSVDQLQSGLRRSKRATRNPINYRQYDLSESETESLKLDTSNAPNRLSNSIDDAEFSTGSQDSEENINKHEIHIDQASEHVGMGDEKPTHRAEDESSSREQKGEGVKKRRFLDLNELAPGSGFDDAPNSMKDEDTDDF